MALELNLTKNTNEQLEGTLAMVMSLTGSEITDDNGAHGISDSNHDHELYGGMGRFK